jgi:hypothetical protein
MVWDGEDFQLDDNFPYQAANKIKNHSYNSFYSKPTAGEINIVNDIVFFYNGTYWIRVSDVSGWKKSVKDKDLTTPPASPNEHDRYIIGAGATGDWTGHDGKITEYINGSWHFYTPSEGDFVYVEDENTVYRYDGTQWTTDKIFAGKIQFTRQGTLNLWTYQGSVADGGTFELPAITSSAFGWIIAGNNEERSFFFIDGNGNVTLVNNSTNVVANSDTLGALCIGTAAAQEPLIIKNNLGAAKNINLAIWYN